MNNFVRMAGFVWKPTRYYYLVLTETIYQDFVITYFCVMQYILHFFGAYWCQFVSSEYKLDISQVCEKYDVTYLKICTCITHLSVAVCVGHSNMEELKFNWTRTCNGSLLTLEYHQQCKRRQYHFHTCVCKREVLAPCV